MIVSYIFVKDLQLNLQETVTIQIQFSGPLNHQMEWCHHGRLWCHRLVTNHKALMIEHLGNQLIGHTLVGVEGMHSLHEFQGTTLILWINKLKQTTSWTTWSKLPLTRTWHSVWTQGENLHKSNNNHYTLKNLCRSTPRSEKSRNSPFTSPRSQGTVKI